MIRAMDLQQLCELTGGELSGTNLTFKEVSTDTRSMPPGALFVALKGPNFNGNHFVGAARQAGAAAALVSESGTGELPEVRVADARIALGQLARANRRNSSAVVLGLTGSQGKTTVKEMTASILAGAGAVHATRGNLNNDIGVPLTLLQLEAQHQFAVIEMGANAGGEIAYTTALAQPDIAHITNIAGTHLEGFGSLTGVAKAKAEIWQGLQAAGRAVVNLDDDLIQAYVKVSGQQQVIGISAQGKSNAHYRISNYQDLGLAGSTFTLLTPFGEGQVNLALPGKHNAANALAAAALAMEAGANLKAVSAGLAGSRGVKGRLVVAKGKHGAVILDDTYNASPASFRAAIDVLSQRPGLRIVIAGDMGELGEDRYSEHTALGEYARKQGVGYLFGTGELTGMTVKAFGSNALHTDSIEDLLAAVMPLLNAEVTVLVKGSRSARMERVVKQLILEED